MRGEGITIALRFLDSRFMGRPITRLIGCLVLISVVQVSFAAVQLDSARQAQNVFNNDAATSAATTTTGIPPTKKQFQSVLSSGRSFFPEAPEPKSKANTDDNLASKVVTPTGGSIKMPFARVAAPYTQRPTLFLIGSVITPPELDEGSQNLSVEPKEYWFDEPYIPDGTEHPDEYYWSPHAGNVFAVRSGVIGITWRKRDPIRDSQGDAVTVAPSSGTEDLDWAELGGSYFTLFPQTYLVSSSPVKTAQTIYWNTAPYPGPTIDLPGSRIGDVYFAYTPSFPQEVEYDEDNDRDGIIDPDTEGDRDGVIEDEVDPRLSRLSDNFTKTVWLETLGQISQIRAQNLEGRIFMEILGDVVSTDGTTTVREHLGFEILEVTKYPTPDDLTVELGEVITSGDSDSGLFPKAVDALTSSSFYYQQVLEGVEIPIFYATRETENANDLLIHWLIEGVEGIRWPLEFYRYTLLWPEDLSRYSHYVRTPVANEDDAKATAVLLNAQDVPFLEYQDITDVPRAKFTEDSRFYTFLDESVPSHRSLLRFNSDDNVAFERVYSWLDDQILDDGEGASVADLNVSLEDNGALVVNRTSVPDGIEESFEFDSQAFTVQAQVTLNTRGDFDQLMQLSIRESDNSVATVDLGLSISAEQPYPYLDVFGEVLDDVETSNLNGDFANGGLRYRADVMSVAEGHSDLTDWQAIIVGSSDSSVSLTGTAAHYGVLFRGNGQIEVWDGVERNITEEGEFFYATDAEHDGVFHRVDLLATGDDGNPFDGNGSSILDVYSSVSPSAIHSYEKSAPGYSDNLFGSQTNGNGEIKNLRVTRISDGTAFAVASSELALGKSVLVTFVGDGDQCRVYLDGLLVGEGANLVGVSGTVESVSLGSDLENPADVAIESLQIWTIDSLISTPRVVHETAEVGKRIVAPLGESGSGSDEDYLAGYINEDVGISFNPNAYINPLSSDNDFETSNSGAIIPVNAIPGDNHLEVWWMRPNDADTADGFHTVYWPSVIGHYTLEWPVDPPEIVLASNVGSGAFDDSEPATGDIYVQNDSSLPGYNPNEEHALMSGGQAFGLRDDLNVTETQNTGLGVPYSSDPFVLLEYTESDSRPAMIAFKVLREKPEDGITFDFEIEAGSVLQPPMPLPLLTTSSESVGLMTVSGSEIDSDLLSTLVVTDRPSAAAFEHTLLENTGTASPLGYYITNVDYDSHQVYGYVTHGDIYDIQHKQFAAWRRNQHAANSVVRVEVFSGTGIPDELVSSGDKVLLISAEEGVVGIFDLVDTSENRLFVKLPNASSANMDEGAFESATQFVFLKTDVADSDLVAVDSEWRLTSTLAIDPGDANAYGDFTLLDRKGNRWVYRGPHDDSDGDRFLVQYFYETLDGFYFPEEDDQPSVGALTSYLRPIEARADGFTGGNHEASEEGLLPFPVTYLPIWPTDAPELHRGETLTLSRRGLPAIRGNSSLEIYYDQGLAETDLGVQNAILHDPTREKEYELGMALLDVDGAELVVDGESLSLEEIPASVATSTYNGDTFFPNLPPHLSERFFMDPNRGENGALVLKGQFFEETVGEDYVMLNVAGAKDLAELYDLCDTADDDYEAWILAVDNLQTLADVYIEDPEIPGVYIASSKVQTILNGEDDEHDAYTNSGIADETQILALAEERLAAVNEFYKDSSSNVVGFTGGIGDLMEIRDDDVAVDSYALTATGLGTGYISLLAGNGLAFTDVDDPVSILVLKVVDTWHPGEVKVVLSPNPLSEKVTVQQVVDLAGLARDDDGLDPASPLYAFDWRLGAPEDGLAPDVFDNEVATLWNDKDWTHIPFPTNADTFESIPSTDSQRTTPIASGASSLTVLETVDFSAFGNGGDTFQITQTSRIASHAEGGLLELTDSTGLSSIYSVDADSAADDINVTLSIGDGVNDIASISEYRESDIPQSYLFSEFDASDVYSELWFSLSFDPEKLGVRVYLNGTEVITAGMNAMDSQFSDSTTGTPPDGLDPEFSPVGDTFLVSRDLLTDDGSSNQVVVAFYTTDSAIVGDSETFDFKIEGLEYIDIAATSTKWIAMDDEKFLDGIRAIVGGTADVQSLSDQHIIMRYGPADPNYVDGDSVLNAASVWSEWTEPQLVEGWIKRVLEGINPFNQRTTDLFNNAVDTDASMLTLAGGRWEGDIALNSDTINDFGLIEIYETVLNRGRGLSIDAGINYGPANDALLLAAGYINDLYMFVGNEALADALNPTSGIGTADGALGDVATALFAFKGQTATLLEEELSLLRGRDDFLPPGVEATPVYNRLFWNYTRGIDSGEVIYAQNYNIQEDNDSDFDGIVNAEDAAVMFPQGHGDAYGHYLTALKGYYSLVIDPEFEWVPRTEGVTILGQTVQVDYTDERKFAAAAASIAKTGSQVLNLTWRQDYESGDDVGWEHFGAEAIRDNSDRLTSRYWGLDHWASRTGQGGFVNWVAGNAMLPEIDDDPSHEGIQLIDRTTVPELTELADLGRDLQTSVDSADAHLNPLGLADDSVPFDISPHAGFGTGGETHFEQVLSRAKDALGNAVVAFDDAKDVTALMRSDTDSLVDLQTSVDSQETAYTTALIDLYGTPYADDIGVGETYATDYDGPDLLHYMYVDNNELTGPVVDPAMDQPFKIDIQDYTRSFHEGSKDNQNEFSFIEKNIPYVASADLAEDVHYIEYTLDSHGFFSKPSDWDGKRESPGKLQAAISDIIKARNKANLALRNQEALKYELDRMIEVWDTQKGEGGISSTITGYKEDILIAESVLAYAKYFVGLHDLFLENQIKLTDAVAAAAQAAIPELLVFGWSNGFDPSSTAESPLKTATEGAKASFRTLKFVKAAAFGAYELGLNETIRLRNFLDIAPLEGKSARMDRIFDIDMKLGDVQMAMHQINQALQELSDAKGKYQKLLSDGNRIQSEREVFRRRSAALTQGYRTRDAAFRIFRDEKLERYNALFDLAARYAFLAAKAFDYETGLLHTDQGLEFVNQIVGSRALGVVAGGEPQFAGSDTGDPGLSSSLAEMAAEWQVLRGRLGLNNPDVYGTTVSLRTENHRILPGSDGDVNWRDVLDQGRMSNILEDEDVVRHCMQIDLGDGLPVPGIVVEFGTEITSGNNFFGQPLAGGDHAFDVSLFATKIFSVGVILEGYQGMDDPSANASSTDGSSVSDPTAAFLDSSLLSATPHIYLIPAGLDAMRSPPLGDESIIRTWSVEDVTIPLPFNIGGSDFSTKKLFQSSDSLTEELFSIRKHQAFRPVSDASLFGENPRLLPSIYTNSRLIGRSVWNTRWKLVIPGRTLLNDPEQGLDVLIDALSDIKIHFETYSYSGN